VEQVKSENINIHQSRATTQDVVYRLPIAHCELVVVNMFAPTIRPHPITDAPLTMVCVFVCAHMCVRVCACVRVCVCACMHVSVCVLYYKIICAYKDDIWTTQICYSYAQRCHVWYTHFLLNY